MTNSHHTVILCGSSSLGFFTNTYNHYSNAREQVTRCEKFNGRKITLITVLPIILKNKRPVSSVAYSLPDSLLCTQPCTFCLAPSRSSSEAAVHLSVQLDALLLSDPIGFLCSQGSTGFLALDFRALSSFRFSSTSLVSYLLTLALAWMSLFSQAYFWNLVSLN